MTDLASTVTLLQLFGEPTRVRLLALLEDHELTVAELTAVTDLGQSTVSTHLGKLREAGLLRDRRAGASTFYAAKNGAMPSDAKRLWAALRAELDDALLSADRDRCAMALRARDGDKRWPDALAGEMERHYSPGRTWESVSRGLFGLLNLGDVLDAGCGDGTIAQLLAPRARSVTCLDRSEKMLEAARARLEGNSHVRCVLGDVEATRLPAAAFDQILSWNVLVHVASPSGVLAEASRLLRPGGTLALVTLAEYQDDALQFDFGHRHRGFAPAQLKKMLRKVGLEVEQCEITSREKRLPHLEVITAFAAKR